MKKVLLALIILMCASGFLFAQGQQGEAAETIIFADLSWDSAMVHNRIAAYIIENGLENNYSVEYTAGGTVPSLQGLQNADIDVDMESWHSNYRDLYEKIMESGDVLDLGKNLPDGPQGWYIPRYLFEGDPERGIEAAAPDLTSVDQLPKYAHLFPDPEDPDKGLIYLGISGWAVTEANVERFEEWGLGEYYNYSIPGSQAAVAATMNAAYQRGEPWVGYWWEPEATMGRLDMYRLKGSEFPPADVNILVHKSMTERAPDVVEFLKNYETTVEMNNEFLAQMAENGLDAQGAAVWFLNNKEDVWTGWVDADVADRVKAALANE